MDREVQADESQLITRRQRFAPARWASVPSRWPVAWERPSAEPAGHTLR